MYTVHESMLSNAEATIKGFAGLCLALFYLLN